MQYQYIGKGEVHIPTLGILAREGMIVTSEVPINHPEFVEVNESAEEVASVKNKKQK